MKSKKIYALGAICALGLVGAGVFAANTLVDYIEGGQSAPAKSAISGTKIRTINTGDMYFVDQGDDDDGTGAGFLNNFFGGYYLDEGYGLFKMNGVSGNPVAINASYPSGTCKSGYSAYSLKGYSLSEYYGIVDFSQNTIYVCANFTTKKAYFKGYVVGNYIGAQHFGDDDITFEPVNNSENTIDETLGADGVLGRYVKVEGVSTSSNDSLTSSFDDEVRVLGDVNKSSLRKEIAEAVYTKIKGVSTSNGSNQVTTIQNASWSSNSDGVKLQNNSILYFGGLSGANVEVTGRNDIEGQKTLIVVGGNVYIKGNIRNTDNTSSDLLGIVVLADTAGNGGNIYIDPVVTDIHATLYAEKSLLSYNASTGEFDGGDSDASLANQLYIFGSVFSENTLGGAETLDCPYYVNATCTENLAKKYDFNFIRRYKLESEIDDIGDIVGFKAMHSGSEAFMGDASRTNNYSGSATDTSTQGDRMYPLIIRYNSAIQTANLPVFNN